jgi:hypothetical protein
MERQKDKQVIIKLWDKIQEISPRKLT